MYQARGLLFDLDGTLVDSVPDIAAAANAMQRALGLPERPEAAIRGYVGNGAATMVGRTLTGDHDGQPDPDLMARAVPLFYDLYAEINGQKTRLYPGVLETLQQFADLGFALACVTNKPERHTGPLLDTLGLSPLFGSVVAGDTLPVRKPDPAPLFHAADVLGIPAGECIMVGDSMSDLRAGKAAAMVTLCLGYGYNQGADLAAAGADRMLDDFRGLASLIAYSGDTDA